MPANFKRTALSQSAAGCLLAFLAAQAQAQTSPWYLGVSQRIEYQSNVLQVPTGEQSDTVSVTSLLGGLNIPLGRQQLFANATLSANRYQSRSALNNNGYTAVAGVNWETIGNLAGTVAMDTSKTLGELNPVGLPGVTDNNSVTTTGLRATARMGLVTRLGAEVGAASRRTRFDNPLYVTRNVDIDEVFGGVRYRPAGSLILGAGLRATRGDYPNFRNPGPGRFVGEGFERENVDLTAEWPISGISRVDARASIGRSRYDTLAAGNYSGLTGAVNWAWQPTGRTSFTTGYVRSSGDEAQLTTTPGRIPVTNAINQSSDALFVRADYQVTGKIKAVAGLGYLDATTLDFARQTRGNEKVTTANLGLTWEATRAIRAGCDMTYRTASRSTGPGYDANVFGCFGEFVLR